MTALISFRNREKALELDIEYWKHEDGFFIFQMKDTAFVANDSDVIMFFVEGIEAT